MFEYLFFKNPKPQWGTKGTQAFRDKSASKDLSKIKIPHNTTARISHYMAKWSNMDIFGNRQKFQQGHLGIGIYIERHSQHFEPNFQYMSRCLECLTFHLVSETLLGIKLWRKYVEVFHMLKIYFELGLLQILTIYVNCELLVREGGKDKKK